MDSILLFLLKQGAAHRFVPCSTVKLGEELDMSQQNASRRLIELEKRGKIEREKGMVRLTDKGLREAASFYHELKAVFETESAVRLKGQIADGLREGAYYLSLPGYRNQFIQKLRFDPYPGTLNLKLKGTELEKRRFLRESEGIFLPGFQWKKRSFGGIFVYPCNIHGITGAILRPIRTHHGEDILELVAPVSIRKKLRKKAGDWVEVQIEARG